MGKVIGYYILDGLRLIRDKASTNYTYDSVLGVETIAKEN